MSHLSPDGVNINEYTYILPDRMIARFPLLRRGSSKLLVYDKGKLSHTTFHNIVNLSESDELMIFNNTKVIQARILMSKNTGAIIEIFLLEPLSPAEYNLAFTSYPGCRWKCMVGNKKKWKSGELTRILKTDKKKILLSCRMVEDHGSWQEIEFLWEPENQYFGSIIDLMGLTPIPPYLSRMPVCQDKIDYQTVYSRFEGSVAAPTAGLHFTGNILKGLKNNGVLLDEVTLHVGAGTFRPVKSTTAGGHAMHSEHFSVSLETLKRLKSKKGKITAVGTTSVRTLESIYWLGVNQLSQDNKQIKVAGEQPGNVYKRQHASKKQQSTADNHKDPVILYQWEHLKLPQNIPVDDAVDAIIAKLVREDLNKLEAKTEMMIIPGYRFRMTNKMTTNFHQPQSTLLLLIAAFIGKDWQKVYNYALDNDFRFLSYGDSSLLIPG